MALSPASKLGEKSMCRMTLEGQLLKVMKTRFRLVRNG